MDLCGICAMCWICVGYVWWIRLKWICVGYVKCAGYVWDMCGVRYANNLLKNPATKRLSGKKKSGEGEDASGFAVTRPDLLLFLKFPSGSVTLRFLGLSLRPASSGFLTLFCRLLGCSSRFGFCCTGVRLPFRLGSGDLSAFAATGLLHHHTVLYCHYD